MFSIGRGGSSPLVGTRSLENSRSWRNRQTRWAQNPVSAMNGRESSTLSDRTIQERVQGELWDSKPQKPRSIRGAPANFKYAARWVSGLNHRTANATNRKVPRVRISPSPPMWSVREAEFSLHCQCRDHGFESRTDRHSFVVTESTAALGRQLDSKPRAW